MRHPLTWLVVGLVILVDGLDSCASIVVGPAHLVDSVGAVGVPVNVQDNTPPFPGALALEIVAGTQVNLVQVDPNTASGHPAQATDATGHQHAWVFAGRLTGVAVVDSRPDAPGWSLTGQASDFTGPATISAKNLGWSPSLVTAGSDASGSVAPGPVADPVLKTASSNGLLAPVSLASAAPGNGLGTQNLSADMELRIPDTAPPGTYHSTLTLTLTLVSR